MVRLGTGNEYTSDSETNSEVVFQYNGCGNLFNTKQLHRADALPV